METILVMEIKLPEVDSLFSVLQTKVAIYKFNGFWLKEK